MKKQTLLLILVVLGVGGVVGAFFSSESAREGDDAPHAGASARSGHVDLDARASIDSESTATIEGGDTAAAEGATVESSSIAAAAGAGAGQGDPSAARRTRASRLGGPGGSRLVGARSRVAQLLQASGQDATKKESQLAQADDVAGKRGTVLGAIVSVDKNAIQGWAYDWNDLATIVNVDVFMDGVFLATVPAGSARPQFDPATPSNPINARAWTLPSPKTMLDGDKHWIVALASRPGSDSKRALDGSPWVYGGASWPTGQVLHADGKLVYGWVSDPNAPGAPLTVSIYGDGVLLGKVTTQGLGHNGDVLAQAQALVPASEGVAQVQLARADDSLQAFSYTASQPLAASWVQVRVLSADGTVERELSGSPCQIGGDGNRLPYGAITFVNNGQVTGWAADRDVSPAPIQVDVLVDGTFVTRLTADQPFPALLNSGAVSEPDHAFVFTVPDAYLDGKSHTIQVFGVNQPAGMNPELQNSPTSFVGKRNAPPTGWLDVGDTTQILGWAYDSDAGPSPVSVEIWVDEVLWKTVAANVVRTDLVPIVAPEPTHGFVSDVPPGVKDGKQHTIRAFALNVPDGPKQELAGSPKEINAQAPFVGISLQDSTAGLTIASVSSPSPAAVAGMAAGDVIRSFDDVSQKVDLAAFVSWVQTKSVGEQVVFRLYRDPSLGAAPPANPLPAGDPQPPLASNERLVIVTLGSR
jgi:hypothetical protein